MIDRDGNAITTPCLLNPEPFDDLVDRTNGPASKIARRAVFDLCGRCPIRDTCWPDAIKRDEPWMLVLRGKPIKLAPVSAAHRAGVQTRRAQGRWAKFNAARLENLRDLIAQGADMDEVLARLGMTKSALWKWCDAHSHKTEWFAISPPQPEAVANLRTARRKGAAA